MSIFHQLSRPTLLHLATALQTGRLQLPIDRLELSNHVPAHLQLLVRTEFEHLAVLEMTGQQIAYMLRLIAQERQVQQLGSDRVDLVWTGVEVANNQSRDTKIVVRELFNLAKSQVTISSYALDSPGARLRQRRAKSHDLFAPLAQRMDENPDLKVQLFVNIQRPYRNTEPESTILSQFALDFRQQVWQGRRLPELFYDPRALSTDFDTRACLHAKCVIVDDLYLFVTSANFTEAAHERNIEAGVMLTSESAAKSMRSQFEQLVRRGILKQLWQS
jgi:phosphatidylserine/phosphatidylglycerophosphate/cardiolipin synthase-like enzyme